MHRTPEPDRAMSRIPRPQDCLVRTRSAVLNVLVAVGLTIAVSGWLLRGRAETPWRTAAALHDGLTGGLLALGVASYLSRRIMGARGACSRPGAGGRGSSGRMSARPRSRRLIAPLGLVYGWFCRSRGSMRVIPFWVVPLALGFLALPAPAS